MTANPDINGVVERVKHISANYLAGGAISAQHTVDLRALLAHISHQEAEIKRLESIIYPGPDTAEHFDAVSYTIRRGETYDQAFNRAASDEIARQRFRTQAAKALLRSRDEEIGRLVEACRPFAEAAAACIDPDEPERANTWEHPVGMSLTIGDFRALSAALGEVVSSSDSASLRGAEDAPSDPTISDGWRPISDAPKDDEWRLFLTRPGAVPFVAAWAEDADCFVTFNRYYEGTSEARYEPKWWQPMPPPPISDGKGEP